MKNKMTVVVVNDFDYIQGGASKVAIDTAQILYENNVDVIFFSATHKENEYKFQQISTNQQECLKDGIKGAFRGLYNFKAAREFKKLLKTLDKNNTIIHIHGWTKSLSSSIFKIAGKQKFKVVLTLHDYFTACPNGGFFNYNKCEICKKKPMTFDCIKTNCDSRNFLFKMYRVIRQYIQNSNLKKCKNINYISISNFSENIIKAYRKKINICRIYNPIDINNDKKIDIRKNKYYLYAGRVSKEKGVDIFCEAITKLNVKGVIVGDGDQKHMLENKYPNIEFVGWKTKEEVCKYMKNAKALIFPSKWYEGAPLTILEAQSMGLPCFVSKNCAGVDFINENVNGFAFRNVKELVDKIAIYEKYKNNQLEKISTTTYDNYLNNYALNNYFDDLIKLYEKMVTKNER